MNISFKIRKKNVTEKCAHTNTAKCARKGWTTETKSQCSGRVSPVAAFPSWSACGPAWSELPGLVAASLAPLPFLQQQPHLRKSSPESSAPAHPPYTFHPAGRSACRGLVCTCSSHPSSASPSEVSEGLLLKIAPFPSVTPAILCTFARLCSSL